MAVRTRFVGIGVGEYDDPTHQSLDFAVPEVREFHRLLGGDPVDEPLANPTKAQVQSKLDSLHPMAAGPLVLMWSGHGVPSPAGGLRLLTADSGTDPMAGMSVVEVVGTCAGSGATQLLVILDTCFSGEAVPSATDVAAAMMGLYPPDARFAWVGVLTSCLRWETARDGVFGQRLKNLIAGGPLTPEARRHWSEHNQSLRGDHVCDALRREWDTDVQRPAFRSDGVADWLIPNPKYVTGATAHVVEHLRLAALGGDDDEGRSWFTGRIAEVNNVVAWVSQATAGLRVVTGSAGTGKSAIVGRVVSVAHPTERVRLLHQGALGHDDPGQGSVAGHAHARGRTADQIANQLDSQFVAAGVLERDSTGQRNAAQLVGALQKHADVKQPTPVIVIDGLDEARAYAFSIARDLLVRLAHHATVVVSTREVPEPESKTASTLIGVLSPVETLDLDAPEWMASGQTAIHDYLTMRLSGKDPAMDGATVADHLARTPDSVQQQPFLLARLVADQLAAHPIDTTGSGWEAGVAGSTHAAVDADIDRVPAPSHRTALAAPAVAMFARRLMIALTWGFGAGFPEEEWTAAATGLCADLGVGAVGADDVSWALEHLGRYIVQDGEAGVAVYRVAHQSLADHLSPTFTSTPDAPFDPGSLPVTDALLTRYRTLLQVGIRPWHPGYLWRYSWSHAAEAGPEGLQQLRKLSAQWPDLARDVSMAALSQAATFNSWGRPDQALPLTEEAVGICRILAGDNAVFRPDLAEALTSHGSILAALGQHTAALSAAVEARKLYGQLAETDPGFLPDLAHALHNLGNRRSELGLSVDALAAARDAVSRFRKLSDEDATLLPDLAMALTSLSNRLSDRGERTEALPPADEAVKHYRALVEGNSAYAPGLAAALSNLGVHLSMRGHPKEALLAAKEANDIYEELAATNPAYLPDVARCLSNLSGCHSQLGHGAEALSASQRAADLDRRLTAGNPAHRPMLASTLSNLGHQLADAGDRVTALAIAQEAVDLYRDLAHDNPAIRRGLAGALLGLGNNHSRLGQQPKALLAAREAVRLYAELAADKPGFRSELAMALDSVGNHLSNLDRLTEALEATRQAVDLHQKMAAENPASQPDLAGSLNNLGNRLAPLGQHAEALDVTEEAVRRFRSLAANNPAFLSDLAMALDNLGRRLGAVEQPEEALTVAAEAVQRYELLAADNPALRSDLAGALDSLGERLSQQRRPDDAVEACRRAVDLYRDEAKKLPAFLDKLAGALDHLGQLLASARQPDDAVATTEEALGIHRALAATYEAHIPALAASLSKSGTLFAKRGTPELADAAWDAALGILTPFGQGQLLLHRSRQATAGTPEAAGWIAHAVEVGGGDPDTGIAVRTEVRRHRAADPAAFDAAWRIHASHPLPSWAYIDAALLERARAWVAAPTYAAEHDYLLAHPDLLRRTAHEAVEDALHTAQVPDPNRYRELRKTGRAKGITEAYRPYLLRVLADDFAAATPAMQRELLRERRTDLLDARLIEALTDIEGRGDRLPSERARALIVLASDPAASAVLESTIDALADPTLFPALLQQTARRSDPTPLAAVAQCALSVMPSREITAEAAFYAAIAAALAEEDGVIDALNAARQVSPESRDAWIVEVGEIGLVHRKALYLIRPLLAPPPASEEAES